MAIDKRCIEDYQSSRGFIKERRAIMSGKTFFITGANSGFGLAIAAAAVRQGHKVIGTVRSEQSRASLAERLPQARSILCDVTEFDRIPKVVRQAEEENGPVDVLINNAGYPVARFVSVLKRQRAPPRTSGWSGAETPGLQ